MFRICLKSPNIRHDLEITLRTDIKGWDIDIPGKHLNDAWEFSLDEEDFVIGLSFKFVLERAYWMKGANLFITPASVAVRKDDAPAAGQAAITNIAAVTPFSGGGGLIQTTSG
jgi:hypothetical protein